MTMPCKVSTSDYLLPDSTFFTVLKYPTYITRLKKITKQHKTYLYFISAHDKTKIFIMISMWTNPIVIFSTIGAWMMEQSYKLNMSCYFVPGFYWGIYGEFLIKKSRILECLLIALGVAPISQYLIDALCDFSKENLQRFITSLTAG